METRESLERGLEMVSARVDGRDPKGQLGAARNRQEAARARARAPRHTPPGDFSWGAGRASCGLARPRVWIPNADPSLRMGWGMGRPGPPPGRVACRDKVRNVEM